MKTSPFTQEEVDAINDFQTNGRMHPFTCPYDGYTLEARQDGMHCGRSAYCDYIQDWVHSFMSRRGEL